MLHAFSDEPSLEIRASGGGKYALRGRFPYGRQAVLSDGGRTGRPAKEVIAPRAFAYRVNDPNEDIHLLLGHSYDTPLASKATGTLQLQDSDAALTFDATITPEIAATSYGADVIKMIISGLVIGLSPGFRIPPERAVAKAEEITQEPVKPDQGMHGAIIRTILAALLYELSIVTRPAYQDSNVQIEARNWTPTESGLVRPNPRARWRL